MSTSPRIPDAADEVVTGGNTAEKQYEEEELLREDEATQTMVEPMEVDEEDALVASPVQEAKVRLSGPEKAKTSESDICRPQHEEIITKMQQLLLQTEEKFHNMDDEKRKQFEQIQTRAIEALKGYNNEREPSRAEMELLRNVVISQYIGVSSLVEQFAEQQKKQQQLVQELVDQTNIVLQKEDKLKEKLSVLAKENVAKLDVEDFSCFLCQSPRHPVTVCCQFPDGISRQKEFSRQGRCFCCAEKGHAEKECPNKESRKSCKQCPGIFHKIYLCPKHSTKERTARKICGKQKGVEIGTQTMEETKETVEHQNKKEGRTTTEAPAEEEKEEGDAEMSEEQQWEAEAEAALELE